jgi:hypothetical protein
VLTLVVITTHYEDWALNNGFTRAKDGLEDGHDHDGDFNIVEFGFNGDPLNGQ